MIKELRVIKNFVNNLDEVDSLYKAHEFLIDKELIVAVLNKNNSKLDKKEIAEYVEFKIRENEDYLLTTYERYSNKKSNICKVIISVKDDTEEYNVLYEKMEKAIRIAKKKWFSIKEVTVILNDKSGVRVSKI